MDWHPWTIDLTLVFGCNRKCYFCGIRSLPDLKPMFMPFALYKKIIDELKSWNYKGKLDFSPFGEPLMLYPKILDYISYARSLLPKNYMFLTTNTDYIRDKDYNLNLEAIQKILTSGLNLLVLDCYDGLSQYEKYKSVLQSNGFKLITDNQYLTQDYNLKALKVEPLFKPQTKGTRKRNNVGGNADVDLSNRMGEAMRKVKSLLKSCMFPLRNLTIIPNGNVVVCCQDWKQECVLGNINDTSLKDIWLSEKFKNLRRKLLNKRRDFPPCINCDYFGGYRQSFYPQGIV